MAGKFVIHTESEIKNIRAACLATARVRDTLVTMTKVGMTTLELDELAGYLVAQEKGICSFLGYGGFPRNICISLNEEVIHGIGRPTKVIKEDDVISLDIGVTLNGGIGDSAFSFCLGKPNTAVQTLLDATQEALYAGIEAAVNGNFVRDISAAVEKVAKKNNLGIVRDYVGHGCGTKLHEPPEIPNYVTKGSNIKLQKGMVLAIEPMFNLGGANVVVDKFDHWTVRTKDKSLSAHFEHTILITDNKPEILTWQKTM